MKLIGVLSAMLCALLVRAESIPQYTFMTYNVYECRGTDVSSEYYPGILERKIERVAALINEVDPDWVALQEVDQGPVVDHPARIAELTGMHAEFAANPDFERFQGQWGVALLSKKTPLSVKRYIWSGRAFMFVEFADHWACVAHLGLTEEEQRVQIAGINEVVASLKKPVFFCGDMNIRDDDTTMFPVLTEKFDWLSRGIEKTWPVVDPTWMCDYFFIDKVHQNDFRKVDARSIEEKDTSDHRPVVLTVQPLVLTREELDSTLREGGEVRGEGGLVTHDGKDAIHTFTETGVFKFTGGKVDVLIVGAGGGGGAYGGGGGAGGQVVVTNQMELAGGEYQILVGAGGVGGECSGSTPDKVRDGGDGEDSTAFAGTAFSLLARGGSGGGTLSVGRDGALGGGGGAGGYSISTSPDAVAAGGVGTLFSGGSSFRRGAGFHADSNGGGGAGAGGKGGDAAITVESTTTYHNGNGGIGVMNAISGASLGYGGGGYGGRGDLISCVGDPTYGGGAGGHGVSQGGVRSGTAGEAGLDGRGGGGGGGGRYVRGFGNGGKGGCGCVIIRYREEFPSVFVDVTAEGAVRRRAGAYTIFTFPVGKGRLTVKGDATADVLLIGGGGGGGAGRCGGGGGGGGGYVYREAFVLTNGTYDIAVGAGGAGAYHQSTDSVVVGANGEDTSAFGLIAHGGGCAGESGASGGGGTAIRNTKAHPPSAPGGLGIDGEGFGGGASTNASATEWLSYHTHGWCGGGGGAAEKGQDAVVTAVGPDDSSTTGLAGCGGAGVMNAISGRRVWYAGGGGGGFTDYSQPNQAGTVEGGIGGGGAGSGSKTVSSAAPFDGCAGTDGLGGGGGGAGCFGSKSGERGGKGGDGIVIVRCRVRPKGLSILFR